MSIQNHRHCQATVLGATGTPFGNGTTWDRIRDLSLPNIASIYPTWIEKFDRNVTITDDLAGILVLIDRAVENSKQLTAGDLIDIASGVVKVRNNIRPNYDGLVGI